MITIRLDDRQLIQLMGRIPTPEILWQAAKNAAYRAAKRGVSDLRDSDDVPRWTNNMADGITAAPLDNGAMIVTQAPYSQWVHDGVKPGTFPNLDNIADWAKQHGMEGAEWAIGNAIKQRGLKAKPFMRDYANSIQFSAMVKRVVFEEVSDAMA